MIPTGDLMTDALWHLEHAAALVEQAHTPDGPALAGQIRLAAATLPHPAPDHEPTPDEAGPGGVEVAGELDLALACLDGIAPLDGPADLQLTAWHVHELRRIAATTNGPGMRTRP